MGYGDYESPKGWIGPTAHRYCGADWDVGAAAPWGTCSVPVPRGLAVVFWSREDTV